MSKFLSSKCRACRQDVAGCRQDVAGGSRFVAPQSRVGRCPSRRRRGLSRRQRGGSPCRKVSWGVAGCRGRVAAHHAAVASGSPPVAPPSRSVAGCRGCRGPCYFCQNRDMYLDTHRRGGGKLQGRLRANTSTLQRSPRVPPQLQFSNLRLTGPGGRNSERAVVYPPTFTSGACGRKTSPLNVPFESRLPVLVLLETNSKDYNSFEKRLRRDFSKGLFTAQCGPHSEPQTYVTNANSIDGGSNIVHRPISPSHATLVEQ